MHSRRALAAATAALHVTPAERAAVRAYQSLRGTYDAVNRLARHPTVDAGPAVREVLRQLDVLLRRSRLPVDLVLYRGVDDLDLAAPPVDRLPSDRHEPTFLSTSLELRVAVEEFVDPAAPRGGVVRIAARAGTPGVWVPPIGDPRLTREREVLLPRDLVLHHTTRRQDGGILVADCEVVR
jgi:hypothetical protein